MIHGLLLYCIAAPSDRVLRARVQPWGDHHRLRAEFVPIEVGPHCINVTVGDIELQGSPFACEVYDIGAVKVAPLKKGIVGRPYDIDSKFY